MIARKSTGAAALLGLTASLAAALGAPAGAQTPSALEIGAISDDAALGVSPGMTLAQARAALPELRWYFEPAFMVDFSALCVERDKEELFCALVYETEKEAPGEEIVAIAVTSPSLATFKGVHVGMPVSAAEDAYGKATLSYSYENEGREYLTFAKAPERLSFFAESMRQGDRAGVYPPLPADATGQETDRYAADAVIDVIWIH